MRPDKDENSDGKVPAYVYVIQFKQPYSNWIDPNETIEPSDIGSPSAVQAAETEAKKLFARLMLPKAS